MGPGFDLGIRDTNQQFANILHLKHEYVTAPNITNCLEFVANYGLMARYYYTQRSSHEDAIVLVFAGIVYVQLLF